jgi:hypothetical protein
MALLAQTRTLKKGRYLRRWARRLREVGFSHEDAIVIAYGSFGLDLQSHQIGVEAVVTNDLKLRANFHAQLSAIRNHFAQIKRGKRTGVIVKMSESLSLLSRFHGACPERSRRVEGLHLDYAAD